MWTPDQTACRTSLVWIYTVLSKRLQNISADKESRQLFVIGALRVIKFEQYIYGHDFHEICVCLSGSNNL